MPEWGYDNRRQIVADEDAKREYKQNYYIASAQWHDEDEEESKEIRRRGQNDQKGRRLEVIIHRLQLPPAWITNHDAINNEVIE